MRFKIHLAFVAIIELRTQRTQLFSQWKKIRHIQRQQREKKQVFARKFIHLSYNKIVFLL